MDEGLRGVLEGEGRVFAERRVVRFQDVDAAGLVFFARFFDYFHDAYTSFLRERGVPLEAALRDGGWVAPLRAAEAEYLRPLRFGDVIQVCIADVRVEETEYTVEYRVVVEGEAGGEGAAGAAGPDGRVACVGRTRHVTIDPGTFRRCPVPDGLRLALAPPGDRP